MQAIVLLFLTIIVVCNARLVEVTSKNQNEPRLFFKQIVEASGLFPIEINVPDTLSAMMSGMSSMYEAASTYFSGTGSEEGDQSQMQQVVYDEVDVNSRPIRGKRRKKKVKKLKKKTSATDDDNENVLDYFEFLMF